MVLLDTDRLLLRPFTLEDAPFILELLNEPSFIRFIADKGVRTLDQARGYLQEGPLKSYAEHGHGLYAVTLRSTGAAIGMCGLIRRQPDQDLDLGYAFLPGHWSQGFALEAARATLAYGWEALGLDRVLALVSPDNERSIALLGKLGFSPAPAAEAEAHGPDTVLFALGR